MKHLRQAKFYVMLLVIALALPACGSASAKTGKKTVVKPAEISFTDMAGREIQLGAPAERIVALTASDCEILYAIGAGDTLVGRGMYCDYPPEAADIQIVESGGSTNIEQIITLKPQVVIMNKMAQELEHTIALEKAGIVTVVNDAYDIDGVYTSIELMGKITGRDTEADMLINEMKTVFEEVSTEAGDSKKTVYFEVSPLEWGLWTAGKATYMDEIAGILGLTNIFSDVEGWVEVSEEQVISRNPDYIITIAMYSGEGPHPTEEISGRAGWRSIKAVRNGNVFLANADELSRPGPRLMDGASMLYSYIYGDE